MPKDILNEAKAIQPWVLEHRRWLHAHPGVGFDVEESRNYVRDILNQLGYVPEDCGKCGLVATVGNGGKCFLLRADMDALPIQEESGEPFAAQNGHMHACGHDLHTAMLLGAARILKEHEKELQGTVKLMFQPAEEVFSGSQDMVDSGVLDNPHVDGGMMIHVSTGVPIPAGTVMVAPPGVSAPAADYFTIHIQGEGCHGSAPQDGVDPLTSAAHILIALQEITARELGIGDAAVLTIGTIHGGTAANAIADSVSMSGTLRTYDEHLRSSIKQRIVEISQGVAGVFRAKAEVNFDSGCPTLVNDKDLCDLAETCLPAILGNEQVLSVSKLGDGKPSGGGSEDFAYISHKIPTVMLALAAGEPKKGHSHPLHHPRATFDETALPYGVAAFVEIAMNFLSH